MEWETCFLAEVFFFKSSFLVPYFVGGGAWSFVSSFGLVASFFSALVLLHFHLVSMTYESVGGCYNRE
jgi:hypothetical protein